eukprot:CAMPEP_0173460438 /NCGR_PEP_ID=MMETSP1357-20121228/63131_1 /TAXON_ID=77926 /ORGANISM="Hemiselmis rufescens, Strain PCC563" /LENGTH=154 /DNA_ID=CAMNT_0014428007 /DNA_START=89 /DNA_END=549 /DNA_ORIENTATION=-
MSEALSLTTVDPTMEGVAIFNTRGKGLGDAQMLHRRAPQAHQIIQEVEGDDGDLGAPVLDLCLDNGYSICLEDRVGAKNSLDVSNPNTVGFLNSPVQRYRYGALNLVDAPPPPNSTPTPQHSPVKPGGEDTQEFLSKVPGDWWSRPAALPLDWG